MNISPKKPIAIIPAKGFSNRVKNKNYRILNGKPLILYTIEKCKKSNLFSDIIINTDSQKIITLAKKNDCSFFKRPAELANSSTSIIKVINHMTKKLDLIDKNYGILLATSPLRQEIDLIKAWKMFKKFKKPIVSVSKYETPIQLAHFINSKGVMKPYFPKNYAKSTKSTQHRESYRFNGSIIFNSSSNLLKQKNLIGKNPIPYIMPESRSIDIDHEYQLQLVKKLIN